MLKYTVIIYLVFIPILCLSQKHWRENTIPPYDIASKELIINDYNQDGYIDTIVSVESESWVRYVYMFYFINGKTHQKDSMYFNYNYSPYIKFVTFIPPEITQGKNIGFLYEAMKHRGLSYQEKPDPSLQWVIGGWVNKPVLKPKNPFVRKIVKYNPLWMKCPVQMPSRYYTFISGDSIISPLFNDSVYYQKVNKPANVQIIYYGNQHKLFSTLHDSSLTCTDTKQEDGHFYKVYITGRGVVLQKDSLYSWIYVCDKDLSYPIPDFDGMEERIAFVHHAHFWGKYVFIQVRPRPKTEHPYELGLTQKFETNEICA